MPPAKRFDQEISLAGLDDVGRQSLTPLDGHAGLDLILPRHLRVNREPPCLGVVRHS